MPVGWSRIIHPAEVGSQIKTELTSMVSHPNLLCLLEGVKTDMKPVGFQDDQIQILMKMKIMKGRGGKEVRDLLLWFWCGKRRKRGRGIHSPTS